jgi:hypothetical protein
MSISKYNLYVCLAAFLSLSSTAALSQPAAAPPACGSIHARVHAVALPDNGGPAHEQTLDQTWQIPAGTYNKYVNPDGSIVTQGYPSNGGSHSWEYLTTVCTVTDQGQSPPTVQLNLTASSNLDSGVGKGTGASSDYDTEWFVVVNLSPTPLPKPWNLTAVGAINASGVTPTCSVRLNNDQPKALPTGPFIQTFNNLSGTIAIFVSCSQGHFPIFPSGPTHNTAQLTVNSDVTLSFSHP